MQQKSARWFLMVFSWTLISACSSSEEESCPPSSTHCDSASLLDASLHTEGSNGDKTPEISASDAAYLHEEVAASQVHAWVQDSWTMTLLDVREPSEFAGGHIAGARNLPWGSGVLQSTVAELSRDNPIVVYCNSGSRSHAAASFLVQQQLRPVYDMNGGFGAWVSAGYPSEQ